MWQENIEKQIQIHQIMAISNGPFRPRFVFTTDGDRGGWFFDADPKRRYGFLAAPWLQHVMVNEGVM